MNTLGSKLLHFGVRLTAHKLSISFGRFLQSFVGPRRMFQQGINFSGVAFRKSHHCLPIYYPPRFLKGRTHHELIQRHACTFSRLVQHLAHSRRNSRRNPNQLVISFRHVWLPSPTTLLLMLPPRNQREGLGVAWLEMIAHSKVSSVTSGRATNFALQCRQVLIDTDPSAFVPFAL